MGREGGGGGGGMYLKANAVGEADFVCCPHTAPSTASLRPAPPRLAPHRLAPHRYTDACARQSAESAPVVVNDSLSASAETAWTNTDSELTEPAEHACVSGKLGSRLCGCSLLLALLSLMGTCTLSSYLATCSTSCARCARNVSSGIKLLNCGSRSVFSLSVLPGNAID